MRIVIAGATGFLGAPLAAAFAAAGHDVLVLSRRGGATPAATLWQPDGTVGPWARVLDRAGAVVNLADAGPLRINNAFSTVACRRHAASPPPFARQPILRPCS